MSITQNGITMSVKKSGSKNNIANRGAKAKIKFYGGKQVKEVKIYDKRHGLSIMGAQYENGDLVSAPDGSYVRYSEIQDTEANA